MITLKIILLLLFAITPFLVEVMIACEKNTYKGFSKKINNLFKKTLPGVYALNRSVIHFFFVLHNKMKNSDNARKFFVKLCLIVMILYLFVDYMAAGTAAANIRAMAYDSELYKATYENYSVFLPNRIASVMAHMGAIGFFFYRFADRVLTGLHCDKKSFMLLSIVTIIFYLPVMHTTPVAAILNMYLIAAWLYPCKATYTYGGLKILNDKENSNDNSLKEAA